MEQYKPQQSEKASIERQANFEGIDSLLLFERLKNPAIRKQAVSLMYEAHKTSADKKSLHVKYYQGRPIIDDYGNEVVVEGDAFIPMTLEDIENGNKLSIFCARNRRKNVSAKKLFRYISR